MAAHHAPHSWDSPDKNTGVGYHFLLQCMKVKSESEVIQLCQNLSDPMDCSLPGSSVHGIFQARVLEWGATAFSPKYLLTFKTWTTYRTTYSFYNIVIVQRMLNSIIISFITSCFLMFFFFLWFLCHMKLGGTFPRCTLYKESIFLTSCVYTYLHVKSVYLFLFHSF